jgi:hypothetical protein
VETGLNGVAMGNDMLPHGGGVVSAAPFERCLTKAGQKGWIMAKKRWRFSLSEADFADHAGSVGLVGPG